MRIDDELVSDVMPEDVVHNGAAAAAAAGKAPEDGRCAYLLFYRRVGTW